MARDIPAGRAFVELFVKNASLMRGLRDAKQRLESFASTASLVGGSMMAAGAGLAAPLMASMNAFGGFQDRMLGIAASTGATAEQLKAIQAASMGMSEALGIGPTAAAGGMLELLKAGMDLETVLSGAGQSAIEFSKIAEMDVAASAVVMSDAMNAFGVDATTAANTLSSAADASSTSVAGMAESMAMASAVSALANQSIGDTSAALAILANRGLKGSDAGTSLKSMLLALMAPSAIAEKALQGIGMSTDSFRDAEGKMVPLVEIIGKFNKATAGLDKAAKDDAMKRIFGTDAIRAAAILSGQGVDGFNAMRQAMASALPVSEKYAKLMAGWAGTMQSLWASMERLGITVGNALSPAMQTFGANVESVLGNLTTFIGQNQQLVYWIAGSAAGLLGVGAGLLSLGIAAQAAAVGVGLVQAAFAFIPATAAVFATLMGPGGLMLVGLAAVTAGWLLWSDTGQAATSNVLGLLKEAGAYLGGEFTLLWGNLKAIATDAIGGIAAALKSGDLAAAGDIAFRGIEAALLASKVRMLSIWDDFNTGVKDSYEGVWIKLAETAETYAPKAIQPLVRWANENRGSAAEQMTEGGGSFLRRFAPKTIKPLVNWALDKVEGQGAQLDAAKDQLRTAEESVRQAAELAKQTQQGAEYADEFAKAMSKAAEEMGKVAVINNSDQYAADFATAMDGASAANQSDRYAADFATAMENASTASDPRLSEGIELWKGWLGSARDAVQGGINTVGGFFDTSKGQPVGIPPSGGVSGTFSAAAAMAMGGGAGSPGERTARATEKLYPAVVRQQKELEKLNKQMAEWGIIV